MREGGGGGGGHCQEKVGQFKGPYGKVGQALPLLASSHCGFVGGLPPSLQGWSSLSGHPWPGGSWGPTGPLPISGLALGGLHGLGGGSELRSPRSPQL
jgi:hypothetical protein